MHFKKAVIGLIYTIIILMNASTSFARVTESEATAVFIYKIILFTQWPNKPQNSNIDVCVIDNKELKTALDVINNKKSNGRIISTQNVNLKASFDNCNVVFIDKDLSSQYKFLLSKLESSPILTISNINDFISNGGILGLYLTQSIPQLEFNYKNLQRTGIYINSHLFEIASKVIK